MKQWIVSALFLSSLASHSFSQTAHLSEYTASYEANANGLAATATRVLSQLGENSYRLSNTLEAALAGQTLANLNQASEFILEGHDIVPQNYSYRLSGVSRASHAIGYNWEAGIAISSEDDESWSVPLRKGVMDQLSYQAALRLALPKKSDAGTVFTFEIIDGDKIDRHDYRIIGNELLATPLGEMNTLKLERMREASDDRITEIWLAIDWEFLLARMEQVNGSGLHIVLELKAANLGGKEVRANN